MSKVFFSQINHDAMNGVGTSVLKDCVSGISCQANYFGSAVDGLPGFIRDDGTIARPPNLESYVFVGEGFAGKFWSAETLKNGTDGITATMRLEMAIAEIDVAGVKQALADGANVNAPYFSSKNPIWFGSIKSADYNVKKYRELNQIWERIMPHARGAMTPDPYSSDRTYFDRVVSLSNHEAASLIILKAIAESGGSVRFDLEKIFPGYGDARDPYHAARVRVKNNILGAHGRAAERLRNPATPLEKEAAHVLARENDRNYWTESFKFPDLANLPLPNPQFLAAVKHAIDLTGTTVEIFGSASRKDGKLVFPENVREELRIQLSDTREALDEAQRFLSEGIKLTPSRFSRPKT